MRIAPPPAPRPPHILTVGIRAPSSSVARTPVQWHQIGVAVCRSRAGGIGNSAINSSLVGTGGGVRRTPAPGARHGVDILPCRPSCRPRTRFRPAAEVCAEASIVSTGAEADLRHRRTTGEPGQQDLAAGEGDECVEDRGDQLRAGTAQSPTEVTTKLRPFQSGSYWVPKAGQTFDIPTMT